MSNMMASSATFKFCDMTDIGGFYLDGTYDEPCKLL